MDKIHKTVHVPLSGDTEGDIEKALAELGVDSLSLPEITVRDKFNTNLKLVKKHFYIATHVRVAARLLELIALEEASEYLLKILDYVGTIKFEKRLKCTVDEMPLLNYMMTIVGNKKGWFERHEEKQAAGVTEFLEILSASSDGDYQCRHLMHLDLNLNLSFSKMKDVPKATRLALLYKTALELCLVGIKWMTSCWRI